MTRLPAKTVSVSINGHKHFRIYAEPSIVLPYGYMKGMYVEANTCMVERKRYIALHPCKLSKGLLSEHPLDKPGVYIIRQPANELFIQISKYCHQFKTRKKKAVDAWITESGDVLILLDDSFEPAKEELT